jgi:hypothetical protein
MSGPRKARPRTSRSPTTPESPLRDQGAAMKIQIAQIREEQIFWLGCILFWVGVARLLVALSNVTVDGGAPDSLSSSSLKATEVLFIALSLLVTIMLYLAKQRMEILSSFIVVSVFWSVFVFFEMRHGLVCHLRHEHGVVCGQIHEVSLYLLLGLILFNGFMFVSLFWRMTNPAKLSLGAFLAFVQNIILLWEYLNI